MTRTELKNLFSALVCSGPSRFVFRESVEAQVVEQAFSFFDDSHTGEEVTERACPAGPVRALRRGLRVEGDCHQQGPRCGGRCQLSRGARSTRGHLRGTEITVPPGLLSCQGTLWQQDYWLAGLFAFNIMRELQMQTQPPVRKTIRQRMT